MKERINKKEYKKSGWIILHSRNQIKISTMIGKIILKVERNNCLGKQKFRISRKVLNEAYNLINKKTQRVRK